MYREYVNLDATMWQTLCININYQHEQITCVTSVWQLKCILTQKRKCALGYREFPFMNCKKNSYKTLQICNCSPLPSSQVKQCSDN